MTGDVNCDEKETPKVTATSAAAVANHFNCRRSSPTEARNRSATDTNDEISTTGNTNRATMKMTFANPDSASEDPTGFWASGCDQPAVARINEPSERNARSPPAAHPTGRQRRERRWPSGKSRNR